jgi:hypothetical protein
VPCRKRGRDLGCKEHGRAAAVPDISPAVETSPPGCQMRTSNRSVSHPCSKRVTSRTAVYGPVRTVVWEGRVSRLPLSRSIRSNIICMPSGSGGRGDHGPPRGSIRRHGRDARQDFAGVVVCINELNFASRMAPRNNRTAAAVRSRPARRLRAPRHPVDRSCCQR